LFILVVTLLISCASDDDSPKDPFIGYWKPVEVVLSLDDGTVKTVQLSECELHTNIPVNNEGSFQMNIYNFDDELESCYMHISTYKGSWSKTSENQYVVEMKFHHITYELPEPGEYYEEGEMTFTMNTSFPADRVMHVYNQELFGFFPDEIYGDNITSYYVIYEDKNDF